MWLHSRLDLQTNASHAHTNKCESRFKRNSMNTEVTLGLSSPRANSSRNQWNHSKVSLTAEWIAFSRQVGECFATSSFGSFYTSIKCQKPECNSPNGTRQFIQHCKMRDLCFCMFDGISTAFFTFAYVADCFFFLLFCSRHRHSHLFCLLWQTSTEDNSKFVTCYTFAICIFYSKKRRKLCVWTQQDIADQRVFFSHRQRFFCLPFSVLFSFGRWRCTNCVQV